MDLERCTSRIVAVASCTVCLLAFSAKAGLVTYDAAGDLDANFSLNDAGAGIRYLEAPGGLGGSQAIDTLGARDAVHTTALYDQANFGFDGMGKTVTVSQFVLRQNNSPSPFEFSFMQLGILQNASGRFGVNAGPDSYVSLRILSDTAVNTGVFLQTEIRGSADTARTQQNISGQTANLAAGNWYKFTATFDHASATQVRITGALEDWGTDGTAFQTTILELPAANPQSLIDLSGLSGTTVLSDAQVWAGWRGFGEGGAALFDNFSAVPEPGTAVLLGGGVLWLLRRRRRSLLD